MLLWEAPVNRVTQFVIESFVKENKKERFKKLKSSIRGEKKQLVCIYEGGDVSRDGTGRKYILKCFIDTDTETISPGYKVRSAAAHNS